MEYPSAVDTSPNLRIFRRKVEHSFNVLKALEENANSGLTGENVSTVSRKRGKAVGNNRRIDPLPFDSMGITVPTTDAQVRDAYVGVLSQLQSILEVCGHIPDSLGIELTGPSTTFSFLGNRWYQRFSNPRTARQNLRTQRFL